MKAYSKEMRRDVLEDYDLGMTTAEVALKYKVSKSWVRRVKQERRELDKVAPTLTRNRTPKWKKEADGIRKAIAEKPDMTLAELQRELNTELSIASLWRALKELKITLKKKT